MTVITKVPDNARVRYPVVRFQSSDINASGDYDFQNVGNTNVTLMSNLNAGSLYLVDQVSFFASAVEGDWLRSMKTAADFPRVSVRFARTGGSSIFGDPFRCVNYVDNSDCNIYLRPTQKNESLVASMFGVVKQVPGMVGDLYLLAQINFTVYEITDAKWIESFEKDPLKLGATVRI